MTENEKYLEMPWSIEETIENLKIIKEHLSATVLKTNLDGEGKQDAKEVEFDFNRAIKALEKQIPKKPIRNDLCTCPSCGTFNEVIGKRRNTVAFDTVYCWHCGQALELSEG